MQQQCSYCKCPIEGAHARCKYSENVPGCPCTLHFQCLRKAETDPKILLVCGCYPTHIASFIAYVDEVIPAPAQHPDATPKTMELFDKNGNVTFIIVEEGLIKIGQFNKQKEMEWELRQTILVRYPNSWEKSDIYIRYKADEETGNGWYIPSSYHREMTLFFDALVRDGKLVPETFRGPSSGTKYTATR